MLSAIPTPNQQLGLFRLVLELVAQQGNYKVPEELQERFLKILEDAHKLRRNSKEGFGVSNPESIDLAVEMLRDHTLASCLDGISNFTTISRECANQVLQELERDPA
jgi:hypothetical protein